MDATYNDWRYTPPAITKPATSLVDIFRAAQFQRVDPPAPSDPSNPYWVRTWPGANTVNTHIIDKMPYGKGVQGWVDCDKDKRLCDILIRRESDQACVQKHENYHASGWDHPNYPRGLICPK